MSRDGSNETMRRIARRAIVDALRADHAGCGPIYLRAAERTCNGEQLAHATAEILEAAKMIEALGVADDDEMMTDVYDDAPKERP